MKNLFLAITFFLICNSNYSQENKKALKTSEEIYLMIKNNEYLKLYEKLEDNVKSKVTLDYVRDLVNSLNKTLKNELINFENFKTQIITPLGQESDFDYIIYRFPLNQKDYFETSFILKNDYSKIFSTNIIRIDRMPDVQVIYGAEGQQIPKVGDVITEKDSQTDFIRSIKYRDFNNLIIIDFNDKQEKIRESKFPLNNLKFKSITEFYANGKISLNASYDNGIVIGQFQKFYENGNIKESGNYIKDIEKDGTWNYYDSNGIITKTELFEKGVLIK
ncbi:toxin-antitoxin system YwqK family antitoxin [Flavobacterium sp. Root186]|uniref:toxin-antitoxin system YwqK family antitoxin n=1 Tax=Flavobacterium sp. Root186 TaxID=1736485 RepID=UPI0006FBE408|nr:hypothetical protein [Flavobacterium sp. Root186]KRB53516.1 hypothetical protein ASD98_21220 [Flavobacterium sp. Root186]